MRRSPSDKRFATAWKNLVADIEKASKAAVTHGLKPANLSDVEWALVLQHRTRQDRCLAPAAKPKAAARGKALATLEARAGDQPMKAAAAVVSP